MGLGSTRGLGSGRVGELGWVLTGQTFHRLVVPRLVVGVVHVPDPVDRIPGHSRVFQGDTPLLVPSPSLLGPKSLRGRG